MSRKIQTITLSHGIALKTDTGDFIVARRDQCKFDSSRYNLWVDFAKKDTVDINLSSEIQNYPKSLKKIANISNKLLAISLVIVGRLLSFLFNISFYPFMIMAIVLLLPHFKDAREFIFDIYAHLHYRDYFKEKFRFNAAINKCLNSYNKLNCIPTLDQAKEANITDNANKKNYIYFDAIIYIINSLYVFVFSFWSLDFVIKSILILAILEILFLYFFIVKDKVHFLDLCTLANPNDEDLEIVIAGLTLLKCFNQGEDFNNCRFELNRNLNTRSSHRYKDI